MRNIQPAFTLPFDKGIVLPGVTCSRSGTATYIDRHGMIQDASANTPRITYGLNGVCRGLMCEESSQNLMPYSDYPYTSTRAWSLQGTPTITNTGIDSPYGAGIGMQITWANGEGIYKNFSGLAASTAHTFSIIARGSGTFSMIEGNSSTGFNKTLSDDWQIFSITVNSTAGGTFQCFIVRAGTTATSMQICGVQFEAKGYATSLIKTSGAAVTRQQDRNAFTMPGFNIRKGTFLVEYEANFVTGNHSDELFEIGRSGAVNTAPFALEAYLTVGSPNQVAGTFYGDTAVTGNITGLAANVRRKFALSFSSIQNDLSPQQKVYDNGTLLTTATKSDLTKDSGGTAYTADTVINIGANRPAGATNLKGIICKVAYYPVQLTDAEVAQL